MSCSLPRYYLLMLTCAASAMLLPGCASNPATGGADVVVMSQGKEVSIGDEMYRKMVDEGAIYDNPELQAYVDRIGQRLVANSDDAKVAFIFTVIDSPDINAFATPGGFVYVNRGLLSYLDNEAELAGVLAHEIAHVTARHAARQQTANITSKVLATTAYILTGSGDLADASTMYGTELVRGYGRDHELEADGLGAQYMHKSGYEADALLEVIGVLKDQEQFQRLQAKATGKAPRSYHGLYATHPRNDQRLQTVIRTAGELELKEAVPDPIVPGEFRRQLEGLVWGQSIQGQQEENRYYHNKLRFSFAHPPGWTVKAGATSIVARSDDGNASVTLTLDRKNPTDTPKKVLKNKASGALSKEIELAQAGLKGYSALAGGATGSHRLAVIDYRNLIYLFDGQANDMATQDKVLLEIIESFRPMLERERAPGTARYVHYIQVPRGATLASLAASIRIPDAEAQLRLLNGLYPRGEPRTGDWIKIIK